MHRENAQRHGRAVARNGARLRAATTDKTHPARPASAPCCTWLRLAAPGRDLLRGAPLRCVLPRL
eukprot:1354242-Lingulodinium_polyedra.AAC.1